jgi:hypothetical protein
MFVDWLTIRQDHGTGLVPRLNGGQYMAIDSDGSIDYLVERRVGLEGSFDSRVEVRADGSSVEFSGNISRFNRRDNLFGFDWDETIRRVNALLNLYSIPPFTSGKLYRFSDSGWTWTGARVSRIDITMNRACFSDEGMQVVLRTLAAHHVGRQKGVLSVDGGTVEYGRGSKYVYGKCYAKAQEFVKHRQRKSGAHVDSEVIDFCSRLGVLREEFTLKSRFLTQNNLCFLGSINQSELVDVFMARTQFRRFERVEYDDFNNLPRRLKPTYVSWRDGLPNDLSRGTFYRHRSELLKYGIDISIPNNVARMPVRDRTVDVAALESPDWYRKRYG